MTYEEKTAIVISQLRKDRDRLLDAFDKMRTEIEQTELVFKDDVFKIIDKYKNVEPEIKKLGQWIDTGVYHQYNDGEIETTELRCSCCNETVEWDIDRPHKPRFCENCGIGMESEVLDDGSH